MNLIEDAWLPVIHQDGRKEKIAPWQIAECRNPVIDLCAPRPDFQGALYQFLIGLLQTGFAPEDQDDWLRLWEEGPDKNLLKARFAGLASAFELDNSYGPAFLQDYDIEKGEQKPISGLLIESPGGKTLKDNLDFFIKRGAVIQMCPACAAAALFTLQTNAPSGGVGHRVGLRGGGPLTTLVLPAKEGLLWHKLWLNVLDEESFIRSLSTPDPRVFPWLAPTRVSDKEGRDTRPEDAHPLQMFWGMPRRIRIVFNGQGRRRCCICAEEASSVAEAYVTRNYGVNYVGEWIHPLTPYRFDPKKKTPPLSLKGQQGGLGYRHWLGLVWADPFNGDTAARATRAYMETRSRDTAGPRLARLWCFGYDMDNMKARCWYDHALPLFALDPAQVENVTAWAAELINAARDTVGHLRKQVKAAWFRRPEDAKGDMNAVVMEFWQKSEADFYRLLDQLTRLPGGQRQAPPAFYAEWSKVMWSLAFRLFETWALESPAEDLDMKRIIAARKGLEKGINGALKNIRAKAETAKEAA